MSSTIDLDAMGPARFSEYCAAWLRDNAPVIAGDLPASPIDLVSRDQLESLRAWQRRAWEAGLIGCDYPKAYGGAGHKGYQSLANAALRNAGVPYFPNFIGLHIVAPTLLFHASEELKVDLLPRLFACDDIWCQGFSEPGAGSDLASVTTSAKREGEVWIINGHKVWTSLAQFSDRMVLLARTDKAVERFEGLTYFVVPIKEALGHGVTVRPLIKITGEAGFNEVLFDNLRLEDKWRVDEVGKGWAVAMTTLKHERSAGPMLTPQATGYGKDRQSSSKSGAYRLLALARSRSEGGRPLADNPVFRDRIMRLVVRQEAQRLTALRHGVEGLTDHPERIPLQSKLVRSSLAQEVAELALEMLGTTASVHPGEHSDADAGNWSHAYFSSFGMTIAGGTSEIQRNIIGERVLGLPKSR